MKIATCVFAASCGLYTRIARVSSLSYHRQVFQKEGIRGFWRGNFANVVRVFPSRGILFWSNDVIKGMLGQFDKQARFTTLHSVAAGSLAGVAACSLTYPLDLTRTRIASQIGKSGAGTQYTTISGTIMKTVRQEGVWALYRGMGPSLFGALPYEGIKFGAYDFLRRNVPEEWFPNRVMWQLFCGASAGTAAGVVMYPNDTVRRLMQVQTERGSTRRYLYMADCYKKVFRDNGPRRFYRYVFFQSIPLFVCLNQVELMCFC